MPRKKAKDDHPEEAESHVAPPETPACGSSASCAESCGPRSVPVEDALVGMIRLVRDGVGTLGGLGTVVAPGLKKGATDLANAASQGLKRVIVLAASASKKPAA